MQVIYIEQRLLSHPRAKKIIALIGKNAKIIPCQNYQEVFNPKSQNFRLQKPKPALILAAKTGKLVLPTPESFGIGGKQNFYFSHMLNCLYDCRYCFLQGMYNSANYVLFINYEDFADAIVKTIAQHQQSYFFSGYDGDSLAFDRISGFLSYFIPLFATHPAATIELRTKSANIQTLCELTAIKNCVVAFSFTPHEISKQVEHGVPLVHKRIAAMAALAERGWLIGLRFDPLIYADNYQTLYQTLIESIWRNIPTTSIHSVSLGPMRFPAKMYQKLAKLYPEDKLLAHPLTKRAGHFSYSQEREDKMSQYITAQLKKYINPDIIFKCSVF